VYRPESVAVTVNVKFPVSSVLPDKVAVAALKVMPAGSVPSRLHEYGAYPPEALST
jgi:hypothetical protein